VRLSQTVRERVSGKESHPRCLGALWLYQTTLSFLYKTCSELIGLYEGDEIKFHVRSNAQGPAADVLLGD